MGAYLHPAVLASALAHAQHKRDLRTSLFQASRSENTESDSAGDFVSRDRQCRKLGHVRHEDFFQHRRCKLGLFERHRWAETFRLRIFSTNVSPPVAFLHLLSGRSIEIDVFQLRICSSADVLQPILQPAGSNRVASEQVVLMRASGSSLATMMPLGLEVVSHL